VREERQEAAGGLHVQAHALHDVQGHLAQALAGVEVDFEAVRGRDVELKLPADAVQGDVDGCGGGVTRGDRAAPRVGGRAGRGWAERDPPHPPRHRDTHARRCFS